MNELTPEIIRRLLIEVEVPSRLIAAIEADKPSYDVIFGVYQFADSARCLNKQLNEVLYKAKLRADEAEQKLVTSEQAGTKFRQEAERLATTLAVTNVRQHQATVAKQRLTIRQLRQQLMKIRSRSVKAKANRLLVKERRERQRKATAQSSAAIDCLKNVSSELRVELTASRRKVDELQKGLDTAKEKVATAQSQISDLKRQLEDSYKLLDKMGRRTTNLQAATTSKEKQTGETAAGAKSKAGLICIGDYAAVMQHKQKEELQASLLKIRQLEDTVNLLQGQVMSFESYKQEADKKTADRQTALLAGRIRYQARKRRRTTKAKPKRKKLQRAIRREKWTDTFLKSKIVTRQQKAAKTTSKPEPRSLPKRAVKTEPK